MPSSTIAGRLEKASVIKPVHPFEGSKLDVAVPLATYTGWALRAEDEPESADGCDASGQRLPFAETKTVRLAVGDPRLSLQERYKDHATYVSLVTAAARRLQHERLLLEDDVQAYIAAAEAAAVPGP
jgi:Alpha/beta hydrolase domain